MTSRTHAPASAAAPAASQARSHQPRTPAARVMDTAPAMRLSPSAAPMPPQWVSTPGEPLPSGVRDRLETSFNYDLSPVRVHSDSRAASSADSIGANAFTYGHHIVLGRDQSASNLPLMAHETTHVIQQQGAPTVQMSSRGDTGGGLEREARHTSQAVSSGQTVTVQGRTNSKFIQAEEKSWWDKAKSGVQAVGSAVGDALGTAKNAAIKWFKDKAKSIPGYDLLAVILGRDPISQEPVERNATNVIRGVVGLVPGGTEMFENLQKSGVIQRAYEWVTGEIDRLNITLESITSAFKQFIGSLGLSDFLSPGSVWDRAKAIFGGPIGRLITFAKAAGRKIMEFVLEGALALGGSAAQRVLGIFRKIGATFGIIADDPVKFLGNLLSAAKGGFQKFADNIIDHLKAAMFDWLFGALGGAGLKLPKKFDMMGIMSIALQVLGLTYDRLRERLVKLVGETPVKIIEEGFAFVKILVTQGIAAAWEKILEFATGMVDTVIEGIRNWIITAIVKSAVTKLATMFNPAGAIIQAIIAIYNTIMFFIEKAQQIAALVESIVDSVDNIARGNISAAVTYVEKTLARTLPVIIGFLARLIGLGGISDAIKNVIKKIQSVVDKALDKVVDWIKKTAGGLVGKAKEGIAAVVSWWKARKKFKTASGEDHTLLFDGDGPSARLMIESKRMTYAEFISSVTVPAGDKAMANAKTKALGIAKKIDDTKRAANDKSGRQPDKIVTLLNDLAEQTAILGVGSPTNPPSVITFGPVNTEGGGTVMTAKILSSKNVSGTAPTDEPPIWMKANRREKAYVQAHFLNRLLGGLGRAYNLAPMTRSANALHETRVERDIKTAVDGGAVVRYVVHALYAPHGVRPFQKKLKAKVQDGSATKKDLAQLDIMNYEQKHLPREFVGEWAILHYKNNAWVDKKVQPGFVIESKLPDEF